MYGANVSGGKDGLQGLSNFFANLKGEHLHGKNEEDGLPQLAANEQQIRIIDCCDVPSGDCNAIE